MAKVRVEFRLSMPGRSSWNGRWSGEGKNYTIVRVLSEPDVLRLFGARVRSKPWPAPNEDLIQRDRAVPIPRTRSWSHRWSDGWLATVEARILEPKQKVAKSDGFNGYDWMVDNIIAHGSTCAPGQVPA